MIIGDSTDSKDPSIMSQKGSTSSNGSPHVQHAEVASVHSADQGHVEEGGRDSNESTPFLPSDVSPVSATRRVGMDEQGFFSRVRAVWSTGSTAPSLGYTLFTLPPGETDDDDELGGDQGGRIMLSTDAPPHCSCSCSCSRCAPVPERSEPFFQGRWKFLQPLSRMASYKPLFHLLVVNFPYALMAWTYIFVCTVTAVSLLVALPLGIVFCFLTLIGARVFARGELALQARFHSLPALTTSKPMPIFTRYRQAKVEDIEGGSGEIGRRMKEKSFLKNTRAMLTDSTTYRALFYFLVIKPGITIALGLLFLVVAPVSFVLVLPAPFVLKAAKRLGAWQANIAVEGLCGDEWYRPWLNYQMDD